MSWKGIINRFRAIAKRVNALCVYKIASNIILLKHLMNSDVDKTLVI